MAVTWEIGYVPPITGKLDVAYKIHNFKNFSIPANNMFMETITTKKGFSQEISDTDIPKSFMELMSYKYPKDAAERKKKEGE